MLESRSKVQKTQTQAYFPMKTLAKHSGLAVGPYAKQHEPKWSLNYFTYDVTHKKSATPNQKFFFKCNLRDWLIRLSHWTAL